MTARVVPSDAIPLDAPDEPPINKTAAEFLSAIPVDHLPSDNDKAQQVRDPLLALQRVISLH